MTEAPEPRSVAAIVLAAGGSTRMGRAKQLLRSGGTSLVRRAAEAAVAAGCEPVVVVTGAEADAVRTELSGLAAQATHNPGWRDGIASSLRCGLDALPPTATAVLVLPCDLPAVSEGLLRELIVTQRRTQRPVVACRYAGVLGVPALFLRECFVALRTLEGDVGARGLLRRGGDAVATVEFPEGALDVDTPADWERWRARREG